MRGEKDLAMSKMSEEQERLLREGDGFLASQVSFDLEGPKSPQEENQRKTLMGRLRRSVLMMITARNVLVVERTFLKVSLSKPYSRS